MPWKSLSMPNRLSQESGGRSKARRTRFGQRRPFMKFRADAVDSSFASDVRRSRRDAFGGEAELWRAADRYPCRHCLDEARRNSEVLLISYKPLDIGHAFCRPRADIPVRRTVPGLLRAERGAGDRWRRAGSISGPMIRREKWSIGTPGSQKAARCSFTSKTYWPMRQ